MRFLPPDQEQNLRARHRIERDGRVRDRIKAILLSNEGWTYQMIAKALMIDERTVSTHVLEYQTSEKLKPDNGGSESLLTAEQTVSLLAHLEENLYTKTEDICAYVKETFGQDYTISGMRSWMHRNGFVYKKPKGYSAKANQEAQAKFIDHYNQLLKTSLEDEPIIFGDSVHPTQSTVLSYGWIKKGKEHHIPTTGMRTRANITGAINLQTMDVFSRQYDKINSSTFIDFLTYLGKECYPKAPKIHLIVDQGPCHTSKETKAFLKENPRIKIHYLPPYSPNLNPIERLWKVMHEHITYNRAAA